MTRTWLGPVVILAMAAFAVAAMPFLPDRVPAHWGWGGEVERWAERWPGALRLPAWALIVWAATRVIPGIGSVGGWRYRDACWAAVNVIILGFGLVHVLRLGTALGWELGPDRALLLAVGLLFLVFADQVHGLRPDSPVGVRTRWARRDAHIWRQTHRLAGMTFLAAGVLTMSAVLLPPELRPWAAFAILVFGGATPVLYSYLLARAATGASARQPGG